MGRGARRRECLLPCGCGRGRGVRRGCRGRRGRGRWRRGWSERRCVRRSGRCLSSDLRCGRGRCGRSATARSAQARLRRTLAWRMAIARKDTRAGAATTVRRRRGEERTRRRSALRRRRGGGDFRSGGEVFRSARPGLAGLLALLVLLGRGGGEVRHRGIIAYRLGALGLRLEIEVAKKERQGSVRSESMLPCPAEDVLVRTCTSMRIEGCVLPGRC